MIESIKIKLNGETHEISLDEARKLHDDLSELFGKPLRYEYAPAWNVPFDVTSVFRQPDGIDVTCGGSGDKTIYQNPRAFS